MEPASTRTMDGDPRRAAGPTPDRVDRYEILATLGAGAMGTVYLAYDPQLDRKVALKLSRAVGAANVQQLLDEGRALARLDHGNVVAVHDVGIDGGDGFLVMELVDGVTLGAWLAAARRPWREIVARLVDAGRGLAAAHAIGIVHRDFKPSNVMIGTGGVRVADFGLATAAPEALAGTPAYLAPELYAGAPASPASDQYAFAVTLYEALAGAPAFAEDDPGAKAAGPPTMRGLPGPRVLHRALARALAPAPADRWPSLDALLDAITRPNRRAVAAVLAVVLVGAGALAMTRSPAVDDRAPAIAAQIELARATGARAGALTALVRARTHGDLALIARAAAGVGRVLLRDEGPLAAAPAIAEATAAAARAHQPLADAEAALVAAELAAARGDLVDAHAQLGRARTAFAASAPSSPVLARMQRDAAGLDAHLRERGGDLTGAGEAYAAAITAEHAAHGESVRLGDHLADLARLELRRDRRDEARKAATRALAIAEARVGPASEQAAMAIGLLGASYIHEATARDAAELFRRQLAIEERTHRHAHLHVAQALANLALASQLLGEHAQVIELHERALAIRIARLGTDHPLVADASLVLAQLHARTGAFPRARELAARAEAIHATALPERDVRRVANLQTLAGIEVRSGRFPEALALYDRTLAVARRNGHEAEAAQVLGNRAVVRAQLGHAPAEIEPDLREAIALFTKTVGAEHRRLLVPLVQLAGLERGRGRFAEAEVVLARAERIIAGKGIDLEKAGAVRLERVQLAYARTGKRAPAIVAAEALRGELVAAHLATTDVDQVLAALRAH